MNHLVRWLWICALLLGWWPIQGAETNQSSSATTTAEFQAKDYAELSQMEVSADEARRLYWKGQYPEAARAFGELANRNHASTALYLNEAALASAAAGDFKTAVDDLKTSVGYLDTVTNSFGQKKAVSLYGREVEKIYYGDPYERAMGYLLLALFYLDRGDYDNALASCKSGILADSDAMENRYQSDFALLHLLEAKCYLLRGQPDAAGPVFKAGGEAFRVSHPNVRTVFSERLSYIEGLKLSKKERRQLKLPETDEALRTSIQESDTRLQKVSTSVQPEKGLGLLLNGDYNTLIVVPQGRAPTKWRTGAEANVVVFQSHKAEVQPASVEVDGQLLSVQPAEDSVADIEFQAVTRGGRYMDSILKGKATFKRNVVTTGNTISQVGSQVGGVEGLAVSLIGAVISGTGGAMTPEADTRCWKTLPAALEVYALNLPEGVHEIRIARYLYFEKASVLTRQISISGQRKLAVIYGPPSAMDRYSASVLAGGMRAQAPAPQGSVAGTGSLVLWVSPPLGLSQVERFPSPNQKAMSLAFSPDPNRIAGLVRNQLTTLGVQPVLLTHADAVKQRVEGAPVSNLALQVELSGLDFNTGIKSEDYAAYFTFSLVDVRTGEKMLCKRLRGSDQKSRKKEEDKCTHAFYHCFEEALKLFVGSVEFKSLVKQTPKTANL
jgi:tetratricopeptide (TPR) repeat protein